MKAPIKAAVASALDPRSISSNHVNPSRRLFVDDRWIERQQGIVRKAGKFQKHPEPVLYAEYPWEKKAVFPISVIYDQDISKLGQITEAYFKNGGQQVQFNIMSYEMLKEAKEVPSRYPEL